MPGTTETGRPYFVMELVRGIPLNEFCDQKRLTVRERWNLFIQVCQRCNMPIKKGIIQCDLKPTNVLVTMADTVAFPNLLDLASPKRSGSANRSRIERCTLAIPTWGTPAVHEPRTGGDEHVRRRYPQRCLFARCPCSKNC